MGYMKYVIHLAIALVVGIIIFVVLSCKTFKPIWLDKIPEECRAECNMSLNVASLYFNSKEKSGSVPAMTECFSCLRQDRCKREVFGNTPLDHSNDKKMNNYNTCLNRK